MQKKYKGIILFTKITKENDLYIKFLSNTDEIISGIVYGGQSKKKKNIFQIGFFLNFNVTHNQNKPAIINGELSAPLISSIIDDKYKVNCLLASISLINLSIIDGQIVKNIFNLYYDLIDILNKRKKWIVFFCLFLFNLLKIIGYEIDYNKYKYYKYFNLETLEFSNIKNENCIYFPHDLLDKDKKFKYKLLINVFQIFETIFKNYHLSSINLHLPNHYLLFKKLIIDQVNTYE